MNTQPIVRPMLQHEVRQLVDWAADEGWNPGSHDADAFWKTDPDGFLAMEIDGQLIGGGAIPRHNDHYGFMGLFIIKPEFRGQGFGHQLWYARRDKLLNRLEPPRTIGLDAVTDMIPFYARGGFEVFTRHCRYECATFIPQSHASHTIVDLKTVGKNLVESFDQRGFPGKRQHYLTAWLDLPNTIQLAAMNNGNMLGYCVARPCQTGWKIGPLFANDRITAEALFHRCCELAKDGPFYLDVPENNAAAVSMCEELGMTQVFECTRMYYGPAPDLDHECIFGVTTLELG